VEERKREKLQLSGGGGAARPGSTRASPGSTRVLGQPELVLDQPELVLGQPELVLGQPELVLGQPQLVLGQPEPRCCRTEQAAPQPPLSRSTRRCGDLLAPGRRSPSCRENVAEPGGSPAEERPEALGHREEQRLLPPAEEERPRGARGPDHR